MEQPKKTEYYLDLRTDYGFKYVFGENKEILIPLLNEFLHGIFVYFCNEEKDGDLS